MRNFLATEKYCNIKMVIIMCFPGFIRNEIILLLKSYDTIL